MSEQKHSEQSCDMLDDVIRRAYCGDMDDGGFDGTLLGAGDAIHLRRLTRIQRAVQEHLSAGGMMLAPTRGGSKGEGTTNQRRGCVRALKITGLIALFLAAIVAANLTLTHWGPSAIIPNAFFLIGLDLVTRDRLADFWGTTRWAKMIALIAAGGLLSYWLNRDAATIAVASVVAFSCAEGGEALFYHLLRKRPWVERAPKAAVVGAAIDSVLFIWIAFGFSLSTSFTQFAAKFAGAVVWTWVIARLLPPPSMAPEAV